MGKLSIHYVHDIVLRRIQRKMHYTWPVISHFYSHYNGMIISLIINLPVWMTTISITDMFFLLTT